MIQQLIQAIEKTVNPTPDDTALCEAAFEPVNVVKNTILEKTDTVPQHLYFINSGVMRLFYVDDSGIEITSHLASANSFITPFLSFVHSKKAKENLESITDCKLLKIAKTQLMALIQQSENFKQFSLVIFEQAIASAEVRANDLATLNAEQRYKKLLAHQPLLLQFVPVQYIASFLGMKPESLSRIRRQINS